MKNLSAWIRRGSISMTSSLVSWSGSLCIWNWRKPTWSPREQMLVNPKLITGERRAVHPHQRNVKKTSRSMRFSARLFSMTGTYMNCLRSDKPGRRAERGQRSRWSSVNKPEKNRAMSCTNCSSFAPLHTCEMC